MGLIGLEGSVYAVLRLCRGTAETLSVTREPEISICTGYWWFLFLAFHFLKQKSEEIVLMFVVMNALYFHSSVWIYKFIHKCSTDIIYLQISFINFHWCHKLWFKVPTWCKTFFVALVKTAEKPIWYTRKHIFHCIPIFYRIVL